MKTKQELFNVLKQLHIDYVSYGHEPIFTVEAAEKIAKDIPGIRCKNLFLKDTTENYYLLMILDYKRPDLKQLALSIGSKRLSFPSPEQLQYCLGVSPGCVTPFALINDQQQKVQVIIDAQLILLKDQHACFHPLINTETLVLKISDVVRFINFYDYTPLIITL